MFYKALGFVVWKLGVRYLRRRVGPYAKRAAIAAAVALAVAAYIASQSGGES